MTRSSIVFLAIISLSLLASACAPEPVYTACTMEAMLCPDGSAVGRSGPDCAFEKCPDLQSCDADTPCAEGYTCYSFEGEAPSCYMGDPCMRCDRMSECRIMESYPSQVVCG